jgi:hypothetical protein
VPGLIGAVEDEAVLELYKKCEEVREESNADARTSNDAIIIAASIAVPTAWYASDFAPSTTFELFSAYPTMYHTPTIAKSSARANMTRGIRLVSVVVKLVKNKNIQSFKLILFADSIAFYFQISFLFYLHLFYVHLISSIFIVFLLQFKF